MATNIDHMTEYELRLRPEDVRALDDIRENYTRALGKPPTRATAIRRALHLLRGRTCRMTSEGGLRDSEMVALDRARTTRRSASTVAP